MYTPLVIIVPGEGVSSLTANELPSFVCDKVANRRERAPMRTIRFSRRTSSSHTHLWELSELSESESSESPPVKALRRPVPAPSRAPFPNPFARPLRERLYMYIVSVDSPSRAFDMCILLVIVASSNGISGLASEVVAGLVGNEVANG